MPILKCYKRNQIFSKKYNTGLCVFDTYCRNEKKYETFTFGKITTV